MNKEDVLKIENSIKRFSNDLDALKSINSIIYKKRLQGNNLFDNDLIIDVGRINSFIQIMDYFGPELSKVGILVYPDICDDENNEPIRFLPMGKNSNINLHVIYNTLLYYLKDKITISSEESREIVDTIKFK
nr:MAG TPA: hypothetical protein [Caudoviricetes sp.]